MWIFHVHEGTLVLGAGARGLLCAPNMVCPTAPPSARSPFSPQGEPLTQSILIRGFVVRGFRDFWSTCLRKEQS